MNRNSIAIGLIALAVVTGGAGLYLRNQNQAKRVAETSTWLEQYKTEAAKQGVVVDWKSIVPEGKNSQVTDMRWVKDDITVSVAKAVFGDVNRDAAGKVTKIGALELYGFDLAHGKEKPGKVTIERLELESLDVARIETMYQAGGKGIPTPPFTLLKVINVAATSRDDEKVTLASGLVEVKANSQGQVETLSIDLDDLVANRMGPDKALDEALAQMEIKEPKLDIQLKYAADFDKKTVSLDLYKLNLAGKAEVSQSLLLQMDPAKLTDPKTSEAELKQMKLAKMNMKFVDSGLTEALLKNAAKEQGKDVAALKDEAKAALKSTAEMGPTLAEAVKAFETFLDKPGTLTISMEPKEPQLLTGLGMLAMMNPEQLAKTLEFKAEAK